MKKNKIYGLFVLCFVSLLLIGGCASQKSLQEQNIQEEKVTTTPEVEEPEAIETAIEEEIITDDVEIGELI